MLDFRFAATAFATAFTIIDPVGMIPFATAVVSFVPARTYSLPSALGGPGGNAAGSPAPLLLPSSRSAQSMRFYGQK